MVVACGFGAGDVGFMIRRRRDVELIAGRVRAEYVRIPESNIWKLDPAIPQEYASILDPLGNAVHAVLAGEIAAKSFSKS